MYKQNVWVIIDIPSGIYFFRTNQFLLNQMPHIEDVEVLELQIEDAGHLLEAANLVYTDQMNEIENKKNKEKLSFLLDTNSDPSERNRYMMMEGEHKKNPTELKRLSKVQITYMKTVVFTIREQISVMDSQFEGILHQVMTTGGGNRNIRKRLDAIETCVSTVKSILNNIIPNMEILQSQLIKNTLTETKNTEKQHV